MRRFVQSVMCYFYLQTLRLAVKAVSLTLTLSLSLTPGRSGSGSQAVIQIAVQQPLYKLTITYWLLPNMVKFIIVS